MHRGSRRGVATAVRKGRGDLEGGGTSSGHESGIGREKRHQKKSSGCARCFTIVGGGPQVGHATCQEGFMGWLLGWAFFVPCPFFIVFIFLFIPSPCCCFEVSYKSYGVALPRLMIA